MQFVIYFCAGVLQDFLFTLNLRFVNEGKPIRASLFSFLTILTSMLVLYNILTSLDTERSIISILIYSLGIAVGTYLGMKNNFLIKN